MTRVVLVAPDNRYLTHITPHGCPSLAKRSELAWQMSESSAYRIAALYQLRGYVQLPVGSL